MKINNGKSQIWIPSGPPLLPILGGSSAACPLKIWDGGNAPIPEDTFRAKKNISF